VIIIPGMNKIKLLQWNVWYEEKVDNIVNFIKQTDADIVCAQELIAEASVNIPEAVAKACNYDYYFQPTIIGGIEGQSLTMGNGIFSRFPILNKKYVYVQKEDPNNKSYETENRAYLEVILNIGGKKLKVGTVHLSYSPAFAMTEKRLAEAGELLKAIEQNHEKFILTGDMNAKPDSPIIKRLEEMFIHADPNIDRPTWTTKPFSYQGFEADTLDWRLDYVFATEDINVVTNKIITTQYSDHLPIYAEIQI
jgi:endonuclease/exonuclease/phosphatase family metal-dependent hydrolase